ncbi:MAG: hypothetical protein A2075_13065 [Geobacteraceae bacterium GWC2_58_44]|nr:MAG: hypothetical protein A2075_13065 [Geobacteraceae bacterium GWC2_58_44]HBG06442.1 hypothetical protein [Geobacter sp.]
MNKKNIPSSLLLLTISCSLLPVSRSHASADLTGTYDTQTLSSSYSVNSNGGVTLTFTGDTISYQGSLSRDGSSINLAGPDSDGKKKVMMLVGNKVDTTYSSADLAGTWYGAGIKTPIKGNSNLANFGYDVDKMILNADGSGSSTSLSTSDSSGTDTFPAGTITIAGDGTISTGSANDHLFMNAGKDVVFHFRIAPASGEQQLFVNLKRGAGYTAADLAGTWYGAGLKTPIKGTSNPANFGYDVDKMILNADGSGSSTSLSTSDSSGTDTFPAGTITISGDGTISSGDPNDHFSMNAGKDVMYQFRIDPASGEQQLFVNVKQGASYTAADLAGTWFGAGIKTPIKGTSNPADFGYDVDKMILNADGSGSSTSLSTSDSSGTDTFPAGTITIAGNGTISSGDPNDYFFMNAGKDVVFQFRIDPASGEQQLFVNVKQADNTTVIPVNGSCGTADGTAVSAAPTSNLCTSGSASAVGGSGPWSWVCNGLFGGTNASCSASPDKWSLSVTMAGNGGGTVHSNPPGIACSSGSTSGCSASFTAGSTVNLFASAVSNSVFGGWSGGYSGSTTPTGITLNSAKAVTATFTAAPKLKVGTKQFSTLQAAYADTGTISGSVIKILEGMIPGTLTAGRSIAVQLEGGYNAAYDASGTTTIVQSPIKISAGTVRVKGIKVGMQ